jgi:hypothetical protein
VKFSDIATAKTGGNIWSNRLQTDNKQYSVQDFQYLIGTDHRDPDDGLMYRVIAVRKSKGLIVVDRQLAGSENGNYDTIHARDIAQYYEASPPSVVWTPHRSKATTAMSPTHLTETTYMGPWGVDSAREGLASRPGPPDGEMSHSKPNSSKRKLAGNIKLKGDDSQKISDQNRNLRRSRRIANGQEVVYSFHTEPLYNKLDVASIVIPRNHRQARNSNEWVHWQAAEAREIECIRSANCIVVEEVPYGAKVIDAKWVYDLKTNMQNEIVRFKARLSARGDQVDFEDYGNV